MTIGTYNLLDDDMEYILVLGTMIVLVIIIPIWIYYLQSKKTLLRGPWDIAHV